MLNRVPMLELVLCLKTISFSLFHCLSIILTSLNTCNAGFLSNVFEKHTIFQQNFQFPTLNDNDTANCEVLPGGWVPVPLEKNCIVPLFPKTKS